MLPKYRRLLLWWLLMKQERNIVDWLLRRKKRRSEGMALVCLRQRLLLLRLLSVEIREVQTVIKQTHRRWHIQWSLAVLLLLKRLKLLIKLRRYLRADAEKGVLFKHVTPIHHALILLSTAWLLINFLCRAGPTLPDKSKRARKLFRFKHPPRAIKGQQLLNHQWRRMWLLRRTETIIPGGEAESGERSAELFLDPTFWNFRRINHIGNTQLFRLVLVNIP